MQAEYWQISGLWGVGRGGCRGSGWRLGSGGCRGSGRRRCLCSGGSGGLRRGRGGGKNRRRRVRKGRRGRLRALASDAWVDPQREILVRGTVCQDRENELHSFSIQRAQVNGDRIELALIDFAPLPKRFHGVIPDLILEAEDHIAVVGFVQTPNRGLEPVAGLNPKGGILTADQAVIASFRVGQQAISLCSAILQPG